MPTTFPSDLEIARRAKLLPIGQVAARLGIPDEELMPYGRYKAKIGLEMVERARNGRGASWCWSAPSARPRRARARRPRPWAWADALNRIGKRARRLPARAVARALLRGQGRRGRRRARAGGADGGHQPALHRRLPRDHLRAQPARGADRQPRAPGQRCSGIDPRRIQWRRVIDLNDRSLRDIVIGLGGTGNGDAARDRLRHHRRVAR